LQRHGENDAIKTILFQNYQILKLKPQRVSQVWIDFSLAFQYIDQKIHDEIYNKYEHIIAMLINRSSSPENWLIK